MAFIYSVGAPFRQSIFKNYLFAITLLFLSGLTLYQIFLQNKFRNHIHKFFEPFFEIFLDSFFW